MTKLHPLYMRRPFAVLSVFTSFMLLMSIIGMLVYPPVKVIQAETVPTTPVAPVVVEEPEFLGTVKISFKRYVIEDPINPVSCVNGVCFLDGFSKAVSGADAVKRLDKYPTSVEMLYVKETQKNVSWKSGSFFCVTVEDANDALACAGRAADGWKAISITEARSWASNQKGR